MVTGLGMAIMSSSGNFWIRKKDGFVYLDTKSKSRYTRFLAEKASEESIYLKGESGKYLTMVPYLDGNIYLKESEHFPTSKCELQVIPHRGKVAFRLKENGKFLQERGNQKDLIAAEGSLNNQTLFTIKTGSIRDVKERIVGISFRNGSEFDNIPPVVVQSKVIVNKGSKPAEKNVMMSWTETNQQSTTWDHNWSMGVSTSVAPGFNVGFAAVTLTVGLDAGYEVSNQQQNQTSNTIAVSEETKIVIPPQKKVNCDLMLRKVDNAELKFTAKIQRESDAGITTFYQDGVWKGVIVFNSFITITEDDVK